MTISNGLPSTVTAGPLTDYFMTAQEVADEQRLSVETMYTWRARSLRGELIGPKSSKRGRRVVYRRSDVDAWIAAQEADTGVGGNVVGRSS